MSGAKCAVLLAALILGPAMAWASEEGSIPLKELPVREKLLGRMDVNFPGMTLSEVLEFFRRRLEINVVLDPSESALAETPITLQLKDVRAQDALTWSLRQVGLRYALVGGIVLVGDRQYLSAMEPMTLRQYDVADLLMIPTIAAAIVNANANANTNAFGSTGLLAGMNINKSSSVPAVATAADLTDRAAASAVRRNPVQLASLGPPGDPSIRKESKESSF